MKTTQFREAAMLSEHDGREGRGRGERERGGASKRGGASYLWHSDFSARIQEVFHVPATLGHTQLGLKMRRSPRTSVKGAS